MTNDGSGEQRPPLGRRALILTGLAVGVPVGVYGGVVATTAFIEEYLVPKKLTEAQVLIDQLKEQVERNRAHIKSLMDTNAQHGKGLEQARERNSELEALIKQYELQLKAASEQKN